MTGGSVASLRQGTYASWDGLSVDPRPFSRLDTKPLPGVANPYAASQGMAGFACFEVGPAKEGGALDGRPEIMMLEVVLRLESSWWCFLFLSGSDLRKEIVQLSLVRD